MKRHRVVLIGCGNIALAGHIPSLIEHPRFELVGLCDLRPDQLVLARQTCGRDLPVATNYQSLVADHQPDACILALHPEHSVDVAIDLLQRGMAVLDEKPLARSLEDGARLAKVVRASKAPYQIGFVFHYCQLFQDAARWTQSFGSPCFYQVGIFDERPSQHAADNQRMIQKTLARSSAITHEGSHVIDWMTVLNPAPIRSVKASALKTRSEYNGPNVWLCNFDFADGSTLQLTIGWLLENQPPSTLRVVGDGGRLDLDLFTGKGELAIGPDSRRVTTAPMKQAWSTQLDRFAEAIDSGRVTGTSIDNGLRALHATIACERSAAENRVLQLKEGLLA